MDESIVNAYIDPHKVSNKGMIELGNFLRDSTES
jgi:hypothetical protein